MSKGDKKAYETMFRRFYPKVHRFVAMLLKNEDDADDVSQLIFLKVWNKREKFADIQNFDSYLFILAKYIFYDVARFSLSNIFKSNCYVSFCFSVPKWKTFCRPVNTKVLIFIYSIV